MTPEQLEHWKDFAYRMARHAGRYSAATRRETIEALDCVFNDFAMTAAKLSDWDRGGWDSPCSVVGAYMRDREPGHLSDSAIERWENAGWRCLLKCSVRAGLDMASAPSAGVVGFHVEDLRRMYPEGIPAWLSRGFQDGSGAPIDLNACADAESVWL